MGALELTETKDRWIHVEARVRREGGRREGRGWCVRSRNAVRVGGRVEGGVEEGDVGGAVVVVARVRM